MHEFKLFPVSGKVFVAVSAGMDSMALLVFFMSLKKKKIIRDLEVVHVHHGMRKSSDKEADYLINFCQNHNLILNYMRIDKPQKISNFEASARASRYKFFNEVCEDQCYLATAHHLDDSFEWWMMNSLKSSSVNTLGIPLRNGVIIRPFLSVTKKQIRRYCENLAISFFEDETNKDNYFERNFIRNIIIPQLQTRYSKMLKHYALRSQLIYDQLKFFKNTSESEFTYPWGSHFIFSPHDLPSTEKLVSSLKRISSVERGRLSKELSKLKKAILNGKSGPMSFSGGVKIFFNRTELLMVNIQGLQYFAKLDRKLLSQFLSKSCLSCYSVKDFLKMRRSGKILFPGFVISEDHMLQEIIPSIRLKSPLFPEFTQNLIDNGVWFCSGNHLDLCVKKNPKILKCLLFIINLHE